MMNNNTNEGVRVAGTPNPICGSYSCQSDTPNHSHLSLPDPCPHYSRLDAIAAKLAGDNDVLDHILHCEG